ncbi:FAD-binding oxidoreductase [Streptomyces sp. NBC_00878]|uniref:NAD(P)/FAD-dependent oxidoreductase n=1 Tax=Streptomyces sp. NBC_00878 TaxID=2975854 RepID=UPI002250D4F0|nr:FAD-dependent oxidoreductase [Streptomyces sp. NBC_00878]MCX4911685.1 FAD-binding oxidoreductase [Streptomyces sp. NBC_00878]
MHSDAVIVGAGVMGTSIALELAKSGRSTVVVDKARGIGHGSTSASSAVMRFNFSTLAGVATAWESKFHWENWAEHTGLPAADDLVRYVRTGLAFLDVDLAPRALYLPLFDTVGVPYEEWSTDRLRAEVPGIDVGRYWPPKRLDDDAFWAPSSASLGSVYTPDAGHVSDPQLAAANLADAAVRQGADFLLNRAVTKVIRRSGEVSAVLLDDGTRIDTGIVVNAAGPWSGRINELAGVGEDFTVSLRPLRQEVHHVPGPSPRPASPHGVGGAPHICIADMDLGVYLRAEVGGGMLIGGTEPECDPLQWVDDPDIIGTDVTRDVFEAQATRAARRLSTLTVPNRPRGVVGVYDVTDDWTPIYDKTNLPGYYVAIGTSGNQFKNAPLVGGFLRTIIDQTENGVDHDRHPAVFKGPHTGHSIELDAFSRLRPVNDKSSGTVLG